MLRFLKKHRKLLNKSKPPQTPAHQTTNIGAENSRDSEDTHHGGDSRIGNQDRGIQDQQLPAQNASTLTPGQGGGDAMLQGRGHTHGGSAEARNEQLGRNTPDLHPAEGDSNIRNQEGEGHSSGVQQPSEVAPERTSGGGSQGGRDADDPIQSGRSRAKERGRVDRVLGRAAFAIELAKGPAEAFTPLKAVLASISGVYAQYQNTAAVKDKIEILRSRVAVLEELFGQPASDEKETKHRERLLIKFKDIEDQLRSLHEKPVPLRYLDNVQDSEDVSGLLEDLQEAVNDYLMVQQMAIYDQGCKLMDGAEKSALNNFRCARGAGHRHGGHRACLKGTRGTVLSAIELWARDFNRPPVYWLNGLAGTGKSTIAKTIAERLFADGQLGASFFCSRDFEDRRNLQMIFPTLAVQLARRYSDFRSILVSLIQSDPDIAYESLYEQMKKLIVEPLNESRISTVLVIDALDECEDEEPASAILSVLGQLVPEIPKVKFFLTGRPEPRVSEGFRLPLLAQMTDVFVLHEVEPDQVDSDIRLFFKTSFSELVGRRRGPDNWPTEEQLDQLCGRAAGLFVYAAATVKFIRNNKRDPRKQLDLLLRSQKIGAREGKTLDSLYTSILQEGFDDDDPEDDAKTRSILAAVVLAANPLSPSTVATLLGFDPEDVPLFLSPVSSLLILQEDVNCPVRPFHKSFPDFITDPTRCTNARFHISPPNHHAQLLIGCLGLMGRKLERNMCELPDAVANSDVSDLKERTEKFIDPALRYACVSWHTHLIGLIDTDTMPAHAPRITPALHQFLETMFLFWLEVLSVLSAARNAVDALQVTTDWLEESPTFDLANDCFRFVTGYFEIISTSSQHIYHSALVVAPRNSIVRKLYEPHAQPLARIVCGAPISWDASTATTARPSELYLAAWSPCDRFIAIASYYPRTVDILDSATLQRLQTLEFPQGVPVAPDALVFSPDSHILTCAGSVHNSWDRAPFVVSWDLQTGGVASVIRLQRPEWKFYGTPSMAYSADGKMVGVHCHSGNCTTFIFICDVSSGVLIHPHSYKDETPLKDYIWAFRNHIWTHQESLQFLTADKTTITIWEVGLTSSATPTEVEALPAPDRFGDWWGAVRFLPAPCRLALHYSDGEQTSGRILVWDARSSRYLLECTDANFQSEASFSSGGRFFACATRGPDIYLWKDSPDGYVLHGILVSSTPYSYPVLAKNGESIVVFGGCAIQLWPTKSLITPPSSISTRAPQNTESFVLEFSPDGMLVVMAQRDNTVTVLNLKSGAPQLTIDPSMKVYGLGVTGNTVVVIGGQKVTAWNLPAGGCVPDALLGLKDRSWTINLCGSQHYDIASASISPDSRYIAFSERGRLHIHRTSTGEHLGEQVTGPYRHRFSPDGRKVWCVGNSSVEGVWRVGGGRGVLEPLDFLVDMEHPSRGNPWGSSRGYRVTKDWWILGPDGKRVLMLPPPWQSYAMNRIWKGQFLALLHGGLSEPVILELDVNRDPRRCP